MFICGNVLENIKYFMVVCSNLVGKMDPKVMKEVKNMEEKETTAHILHRTEN